MTSIGFCLTHTHRLGTTAIHDHELDDEGEPGAPVEDLTHGFPRLTEVGLLDRDERNDEQGRNGHGQLEFALNPEAALVHACDFDG